MSVTIKTPGGNIMVVERRQWSSADNPMLADSFNLPDNDKSGWGGDPDPDLIEANRVLRELGGGEIISRTDPPKPDPMPGGLQTVY